MTKFPLNEPLKTVGGFDAEVHFYDSAGRPCGSIAKGGKWQITWGQNGEAIGFSSDCNLIPPKPKVRRATISVAWDGGVIFDAYLGSGIPIPMDKWTEVTITHPDDAQEVTLKDITKAMRSHTGCLPKAADAVYELLKERGLVWK